MALDVDRLLARVHELVVPDLPDLVGIHLPPSGVSPRCLAPHSAPEPPHPRRAGPARRLLVEEAKPYDTALPAVRAYPTDDVVLVDDIEALPAVADVNRVRRRGGASGAALPLIVDGIVLGTLGLARRAGPRAAHPRRGRRRRTDRRTHRGGRRPGATHTLDGPVGAPSARASRSNRPRCPSQPAACWPSTPTA